MENSNDTVNETTRMDISHDMPVNTASVSTETKSEDEVPTSTKVKIIAALAIVAIAGYVAYWVQEPVSLKADVLSSDEATTPTTADTTSTNATTESTSTTVADTSTPEESAVTTGPSVSVDVSLYGFEPATLKIDKGTTVVWTNTSTADQTIIGSSTNGQSFASKVMTPGDTFSYKFDQDATFEYYSTFNPALKATLAVGLGTVEPATTDVATGTVADASTDTLFGSASETATSSTESITSTPIQTLGSDALTNTAATTSTTATGAETTKEDLKAAAAEVTPARLAKTGPAENLYIVALLTIAWFNRKKLAKVFNK